MQKRKNIIIKVSQESHDKIREEARREGRTVAGLVRVALKKVFNIDL